MPSSTVLLRTRPDEREERSRRDLGRPGGAAAKPGPQGSDTRRPRGPRRSPGLLGLSSHWPWPPRNQCPGYSETSFSIAPLRRTTCGLARAMPSSGRARQAVVYRSRPGRAGHGPSLVRRRSGYTARDVGGGTPGARLGVCCQEIDFDDDFNMRITQSRYTSVPGHRTSVLRCESHHGGG